MGIAARSGYDCVVMKYCNECGAAVARRWIDQDERERYVCLSCGTVHYENPRVIVSCIASVGDKILMCRRAQEPGRGQWAPPAGFLECGETLQQGAARETYEETGVTIDPDRLDLSGVINIPGIDQILVTFRIDLEIPPVLRPGRECLEVTFLSEHEVPERDFAWRGLLGPAPARFFTELRSRDFSVNLITVGPSPGVGFSERYYKIQRRR
jgi:ADP-ribose pyrophosphatase YjhB (NUDIX family)